MAVVKRIGPGSAFKVGAVVYAFIGLVVAALMVPFMMFMSTYGPQHGDMGAQANGLSRTLGAGFGLASFIFFPILYGVIGGIGGALMALIYNLAAGWIGGLEVEVE